MRTHLLCFVVASVTAGVLALGACDAIFGIEPGSPAGSGGAMETGDGGPRDGGDAGFPTTPVLDDFNRPDGGLGPSWSVETEGNYTIAGDKLFSSVVTPGVMVWSAAFGPTQEVYITIVSIVTGDGGDAEIELILKNQGSTMECDGFVVDYQPSVGVLTIFGCAGGNFMQVAMVSGFALGPGDQFGARAGADGKIEVFKNGVSVVVADASMFGFPYTTTSGRIGLYSSGLTAPEQLDTFGGGTTP